MPSGCWRHDVFKMHPNPPNRMPCPSARANEHGIRQTYHRLPAIPRNLWGDMKSNQPICVLSGFGNSQRLCIPSTPRSGLRHIDCKSNRMPYQCIYVLSRFFVHSLLSFRTGAPVHAHSKSPLPLGPRCLLHPLSMRSSSPIEAMKD